MKRDGYSMTSGAAGMLILLSGCVAADALAQNYPAKPVRYIMPSTGASEVVGRLIAQGMTEALGQQVFVDVRDFAPVTRTDTSPLIVVVHPSLPVKSTSACSISG